MPSAKADAPNDTIRHSESAGDQPITIDRRKPGAERRQGNPDALDVGVMKNPRRKKQRRRHIDPTTCERDYSDPEIEFMRAMDDYKRSSGRMFPTCSEVLEVIRDLGYVRLNEAQRQTLGLDEDDEGASRADEAEHEAEAEGFDRELSDA
jgi:hypothetical protein